MEDKRMGLNRRQFVTTTAGVTAGVLGLNSYAQEATGPIVLGQSCALTGPSAQLGIQFSQGAKLYFNQLNAQGGVGRRQVELRTLDDGYEPDRCVANTQKFLSDDVTALFGYLGTPTSMAALPLLQKAKVPLIAPLTGGAGLRDPKLAQIVFNLRASYADETAMMVKQLVALGLKKIAVFYQNDAYGQSGMDGVTVALQSHGLRPVGAATVERNSTDVTKAVKSLLTLGSDVIVQVGTYGASAAFVRAARQAGYGGQFYNVSFVGTSALSQELGKEAEGVVVSQVVPSPFKTSNPLSREFLAALQKSGEAWPPNYSSLEGYLAARVVGDALKSAAAANRLQRDGLVAALDAMNGQRVAGFPIAFRPQAGKPGFVELSMLTGDGKVRV
ncbi:ABC transporter substrate-binding protein [Comamonas sp. Y33R10-2]|uniref:ABC transporter substrate-binding protein n=1 Tax=Comamonas sp. Y33R10-2 TaxID=2853257 RepID=UPI001C5CC373|nr:ABC transporter substrate-binding protein [Comamonas sp. Y33R10-2]QXZ09210.1 ABC transporter substrate-binding protein [Comamonas sp. Y33R10-2]